MFNKEEFKASFFLILVDQQIRELSFVYVTSKQNYMISLSSMISSLYVMKKGDTRKVYPAITLTPYQKGLVPCNRNTWL